jgi:hypothetical protein
MITCEQPGEYVKKETIATIESEMLVVFKEEVYSPLDR